MIVKTVRVQNFRSLLDCALSCGPLTALVGPNGAGKSCFLRALELFYAIAPKVAAEDLYGEDTTLTIEVAITFTGLGPEAKAQFATYLDGEELTVVRVIRWESGKVTAPFHGVRRQVPAFVAIRVGKAAEAKPLYEALRNETEFAQLPRWVSKESANKALDEWETANPNKCQRQRDDGQFFGFAEVAQGYLGRYTRLLLIPAVRDAGSDAAEGKGSPITELMDLVVRSTIAQSAGLTALRDETQQKYNALMDPVKLEELQELGTDLSETLKVYAPGSTISLDWQAGSQIEFPLPKAEVRLVEDGYHSTVSRTGHGLQRAFILTMLQHLAFVRTPSVSPGPEGGGSEATGQSAAEAALPPDLLLVIEEPELYQHPSRQRHLAEVLMRLATGGIPGIGGSTQVIYATHSPLFVGLDRFDQVRRLVKTPAGLGKPKATKVVAITLEQVAEVLWIAANRPEPKFTAATVRPRLQTILTPWMSEGFFADVVVLVEGEDDRAALLGVATSVGRDLEALGVAVVPCMGKTNLDRPWTVFQNLGIQVFMMWDNDEGGDDPKPDANRALLRLLGHPEEDWPACVEDRFACFKGTLDSTLRREIGEARFDRLCAQLQEELGLPKKKHAMKNPVLLRQLIDAAAKEGATSATLEAILGKIAALRGQP